MAVLRSRWNEDTDGDLNSGEPLSGEVESDEFGIIGVPAKAGDSCLSLLSPAGFITRGD
jgi:hypothetical protein